MGGGAGRPMLGGGGGSGILGGGVGEVMLRGGVGNALFGGGAGGGSPIDAILRLGVMVFCCANACCLNASMLGVGLCAAASDEGADDRNGAGSAERIWTEAGRRRACDA